MLLALEEGICACAAARYAASKAVASLEGVSALLLRLCSALRPAQHAERSLKTGGRSKRSHLLVEGLLGAASRVVCRSRNLWAQQAESPAGHGTGERSERSHLLVMGLVGAASGVVCWSQDWWAQRAESSTGHGTGGRSERSRLLDEGLVSATSGVVCW